MKWHWYTRVNRILLRLSNASFGTNVQIYNKFYLEKHIKAKLVIGNDFTFMSGDSLNPLSRNIKGCMYLPFASSEIIIGDGTGISSVCIWAKERITIGNRVKIGGDCIIMDTDAHNLNYIIRSSNESYSGIPIDAITAASSPIVIGDDVLIGTRCIILKGVIIGDRSVIGSGSIVTKSIPADSIAAGNPCKVIRNIK